MIESIKAHFWHYTILATIILAGGIVFFSCPDKTIKLQVGILTTLAYIFWGIFHHLLENNLNFKIMIEYTLIGVLAIILLGGVLL